MLNQQFVQHHASFNWAYAEPQRGKSNAYRDPSKYDESLLEIFLCSEPEAKTVTSLKDTTPLPLSQIKSPETVLEYLQTLLTFYTLLT